MTELLSGFEAFHAVLQMAENRDKFKAFRIPMVKYRMPELTVEYFSFIFPLVVT